MEIYKSFSARHVRQNPAARQIKPLEDQAKSQEDPIKAIKLWTRVCLDYFRFGYKKEAAFALLIALARLKEKENQTLFTRELEKDPAGKELINQTKSLLRGRVNKLLRRARIHIGLREFQAALNIYLCLAVELAGLDFKERLEEIYFQALGSFWSLGAYDSACVIYKKLIKLDHKPEKKAEIQLGFIGRCIEVVENLPDGRQRDRLLSRACAFLRQVDSSEKPIKYYKDSARSFLQTYHFWKINTDIPEEIRMLWLKIAVIHQASGRLKAASFAHDQAQASSSSLTKLR
jgi:hypothetical protein